MLVAAAAESFVVASLMVASSVLDQSLLEKPIVEAASLFDGTVNPDCLREYLASRPITDPTLRTRTKEPFFKTSRAIPTVGNALRESIDEYEKTRRYDAAGLEQAKTTLYYERAKATAIANLDYLDLLRNVWLDALQELDALLQDTTYSGEELRVALGSVNDASRDFLAAAQIALPKSHFGEKEVGLCR